MQKKTILFFTISLGIGTIFLFLLWKQQPDWMTYVQQAMAKQEHEQFQAHDKLGKHVMFEWIKIDQTHSEFTQKVHNLSEIYGAAFAPMARQLVMARPEVVSTISHYRPLEHIVKACSIENIEETIWILIEEKMKEGFITSFKKDEISLSNDTHGWFIIAKDKETLQPLGFVQFSVSPSRPFGTIRIDNIACKPAAQRHGLGMLMLGAIFKLLPKTTHIYLRVLETNQSARNAYASYGFKECIPLQKESRHAEFEPYMISLMYNTRETDMLQAVAKKAFFTDWMTDIEHMIEHQKHAEFEATDKLGNTVNFEWHMFDESLPGFDQTMKSISDIVVKAYTPVELHYVQKHPESIAGDFKYLESLFDKGIENVNWAMVEEHVKANLKKLIEIDFPTIFGGNTLSILVVAKNQKTQKQLGVVLFLINPDCAYGDVCAPVLGIIPEAQHRGLGKLLLGLIFRLISSTKRIILSTRITNEQAINAYNSWGFTDYPVWTNVEKGWIGFEYRADKSDILQKTANQLKVLKR